MVLVGTEAESNGIPGLGEPFPREVEFVISALEAGPRPLVERQKVTRSKYRVRAMMKLFSDGAEVPGSLLFTRHISTQAVGFLSARRLPLSHGGLLSIPSPDGKVVEIACTVLRCREAAPGWFEGALYFNRDQMAFDAAEIERVMGPAGQEE